MIARVSRLASTRGGGSRPPGTTATMGGPVQAYPSDRIRNVAARRPRRHRQDEPGGGAAQADRPHRPGRPRRGRHHRDRLRGRGEGEGLLGVARGRRRSSGTATRSTCSTHRATPTSSPRCRPACRVADLVLLVVGAVEGVEVQHEIVWQMAADLDLPRMVFVNKVDRERAPRWPRRSSRSRRAFGTGVAPLQLPLGVEADFDGVVAILADTAFRYADDFGSTGRRGPRRRRRRGAGGEHADRRGDRRDRRVSSWSATSATR